MFGIAASSDQPLRIASVYAPEQQCTGGETEITDGIAKYVDMCIHDWGLESASQFMRVWLHTHPGNSAEPSSQDWETFEESHFMSQDFSVMFIIARGGNTTCHLRINSGGLSIVEEIGVQIDWKSPYLGLTQDMLDSWEAEYANVTEVKHAVTTTKWVTNKGYPSYPSYYSQGSSHSMSERGRELLDKVTQHFSVESLYDIHPDDLETYYDTHSMSNLDSSLIARTERENLRYTSPTSNLGMCWEEYADIMGHLEWPIGGIPESYHNTLKRALGLWSQDISKANKRFSDYQLSAAEPQDDTYPLLEEEIDAQ